MQRSLRPLLEMNPARAREQDPERAAPFEQGEVSSDARVWTHGEGEIPRLPAIEAKLIGGLVLIRIAIRRTDEELQLCIRWNRLSMDLDRARRPSVRPLHGRPEAKNLRCEGIDRIGIRPEFGIEFRPLTQNSNPVSQKRRRRVEDTSPPS